MNPVTFLPLAGYKGYGLAMLVELLCGVLSGGPCGKHIRKWQNDSRVANLVRESADEAK